MTRCSRLISLVAISFLLVGCQLFSPAKTVDPYRYIINKMPQDIVKHRRHRKIIMVLPIETPPAFNTTGMAYTQWPHQIGYYAQNEWVETPPQMLLPLVVASLQESNYYRAVVTAGYAGRYDYALYLQLLNLRYDFTSVPAIVDLTMRAQLFKMSRNQVVATKTIEVVSPMAYRTPYSGVLAANRAAAEIMRRLVIFTIRYS